MAKKKYYTVWIGREKGVYHTWAECEAQTKGFTGAKQKAFNTLQEAEEAFKNDYNLYFGTKEFKSELSEEQLELIGQPDLNSISVDAAWDTITKEVEYKGVNTKTKEVLFSEGPFKGGTINVAEFLVIVHALEYCKKNNLTIPIYSDSYNAIKWVKEKKLNTTLPLTDDNKKLFRMIERSIQLLNENIYINQILKWETKAWGENPADFGRK
ncbi:viroplasmin family protein [[Flexibacter] sp. ATCC 35208]|uniref:ribonuclease H1 domain-containing protein n=1 Tax=[Flexibacter] sp. ATCC 35208 TaxID=1936242 RepID=UPI0009CB0F49|nr:ribonuclease H family protein [[Flexibacter] sp. ATCC 35208]OMP75795.1 ribonuclease H [[Flexibacter] sp. ATCC 35208]